MVTLDKKNESQSLEDEIEVVLSNLPDSDDKITKIEESIPVSESDKSTKANDKKPAALGGRYDTRFLRVSDFIEYMVIFQ